MLEPELDAAVADFDRPPGIEPERAETSIEPQRHEPAPESSPASGPPAHAEPPRRRSTVREPAPFIAGEAPGEPSPASARETSAPEPEPAAPPAPERAAETEGADRPRRTGWWARRLAGKS